MRPLAVPLATLAILVSLAGPSPARAPRHFNRAVASWYYDAGQTASNQHYKYGFASLLFGSRWGHEVRFCARRCVTGKLDDHGPYVGGRLFDLNPALKSALGCSDLCEVFWR